MFALLAPSGFLYVQEIRERYTQLEQALQEQQRRDHQAQQVGACFDAAFFLPSTRRGRQNKPLFGRPRISDRALLKLEEARLQQPVQQLHHRDGSDQRLRPLVTTLTTAPPDDDDQSSTDGELEAEGIVTVDDAQAALDDIATFEEQDDTDSDHSCTISSEVDSADMEVDSDGSAVDREADLLSVEEKQEDGGDVVCQPVSLVQHIKDEIQAENLTYVPVPELADLPMHLN